jgi:hypothetical protein
MGLRNIGAKKHFIFENNQITYPICSEEDLHEWVRELRATIEVNIVHQYTDHLMCPRLIYTTLELCCARRKEWLA